MGREKSNVQIPKINTLFIWIFYKIPIKTNKKPLSSLCEYVQAKGSALFISLQNMR